MQSYHHYQHHYCIGSFYYCDPETQSMIAKIDDLTATFHFDPAINSIVDNKKFYASMEDLGVLSSNAQYWGTYTV